jgi:hypothetical protein
MRLWIALFRIELNKRGLLALLGDEADDAVAS